MWMIHIRRWFVHGREKSVSMIGANGMTGTKTDAGLVIAGFYDAALGRCSWEDALGLATAFLGAHAATFSSHDSVTRQSLLNIGTFGADEAFSESFRTA
jgi:hypothetical protein